MRRGASDLERLVRVRWRLRGQVQGVGFRPFVYRLAIAAGATGRVFNDAQGVILELQGRVDGIARFRHHFNGERPPLIRIDHFSEESLEPVVDEACFTIEASDDGRDGDRNAAVTVDTAVCPNCLAEMQDAKDRRHGHGLINCTNCGPRYSVIRGVPYDRCNTTMADFAMCARCAAEYADPMDRRFHAQPTCCPSCGPRVEVVAVVRGDGRSSIASTGQPPFEDAARRLLAGQILAIKGIGGFHLALRADDATAVGRLRSLKRRDSKPLAVMARDVAMARRLVALSPAAEAALASPQAPIVLAPRRPNAPVDPFVAPGVARLGVMLPYTPIHHLLWTALDLLTGSDPPPLVMTSGNVTDEPLAIDNDEAVARLAPLCDAFLWHDRPIERCVDDSVVIDRGPPAAPLPLRRSRGFAPVPTLLPSALRGAHGLCLGGELKSAVAIVRGDEVIVSQHLGDLTNVLAYQHFQKAIDDLSQLFDARIDFVAHDLHPAYLSTAYAHELAARLGAPLVGVQHHHAHAAALLGEHRIMEPALVVVCDGTGYGTDGTIWGGELLRVNPRNGSYRRVARLKPIPLPGGDAAARDTRRPALALLHLAFGDAFTEQPEASELFPDPAERQLVATMIRRGVNSPLTSSTGRVFDGVAALLGICTRNGHEAQAGMALEAIAAVEDTGDDELFDLSRHQSGLWEIDLSDVIRAIVTRRRAGVTPASLSSLLHQQLAKAWRCIAVLCCGDNFGGVLGFTGGVFCNQVLATAAGREARSAGFSPLFHDLYPPNDAGIAFGQAIVAAGAGFSS